MKVGILGVGLLSAGLDGWVDEAVAISMEPPRCN